MSAERLVRRRFWALLAVLVAGFRPWRAVRGEVTAGVPDLRDRLEKGLKARFPAEFAFINLVVGMVERGELPADLVNSTFDWARKNKPGKKYMVPYFERALRIRAQELGIVIPSTVVVR